MLILLSTIADAQHVSEKGRFSVDVIKGCIPYQVVVTNLTNEPEDRISWYLQPENENEDVEITPEIRSQGYFTVNEVKRIRVFQMINGDNDVLIVEGFEPTQPQFSAYACNNRGGIVYIQDPVYDYYEVMFGLNTSPIRADASTNFSASGQFATIGDHLLTVRGFYDDAPDNCGESSITLMALAQLPQPQWKGLQWDQTTNMVTLEYGLDPQVLYQLEVLNPSTGMFERLNGLGSTSSDTSFVQQNLDRQYYCYRITALDDCSGNSVSSDPICTATWSVSAQDGYNHIQYQTHPSFGDTVVVQRPTGDIIASNIAPNGTFQDKDVLCRQEYCYQLQLKPSNDGSASSLSNVFCVEAISSSPLPQVRDIASIWDSNRELLIIPQFPIVASTLNLTVMDEDGKIVAAFTGESLVLTTTPSAKCYSFTYGSLCATQTATPTRVCPLYLQNGADVPDEFVPSWNSYVGYAQGVASYFLEEINQDGEFVQGWDLGTELSFTGFGTFSEADLGRQFRVIAYPTDATVPPSYSNIFTYTLVMKGYFPNAFSPNGDGINDEFKILGKFVQKASIWVYSRWGEKLFHTNNKNKGWDGMLSGELLPEGTYVYKAEVTTRDGKQETISGTIFLKR